MNDPQFFQHLATRDECATSRAIAGQYPVSQHLAWTYASDGRTL